MLSRDVKVLLCLPGLGGHPSVFGEYAALLPEYRLRILALVNRRKALEDARAVIQEEGRVILFCHCYAAQMGVQLATEMPDKIAALIFLEPFFSEFQTWLGVFRPLNRLLLGVARLMDRIGLRRRHFTYQPDYVALAKYPIFVQPLFDMRWQDLTDYLDKTLDILTYKLPSRVDVPVIMVFSPHGFSRDPKTRIKLKRIFPKATFREMQTGTHNVVTMGAGAVAQVVRESLMGEKANP